MRRGEVFWGVLLVILGGLFLLKAAGYLAGDVFGWFWPLCIIAIGAWILLGGSRQPEHEAPGSTFTVPLQGAREASLTIAHGMGRMELRAGAAGDEFLRGSAAAATNHSARLLGERLEVKIDAGPSSLPFLGPEGGVWKYRISPEVPTSLTIQAGASQVELDLAELNITRVAFEGGASSLNLSLPARPANTLVEIEAGAASIRLHAPEGVAVRFRNKAVGTVRIDEMRFPRREAGLYQSADYDTSAHRADITVDGGATSIELD